MQFASLHSLRTHRSVRVLLVAGVIALGGLAVACEGDEEPDGSDASPTATATATTSPTGTATSEGTMVPDATQASVGEADASLEAYSGLVEQVTAAFPDVTLIEDTGAFEVGDLVGDGRRVLVFGTAAGLPTFIEIEQTLRGVLEDDGWTEDTAYAADAPASTLSVWRKGEDTAVLAAGTSPQDPSACPADQIIGECLDSLEPSEINVQGSISVALRSE